jgi:RNA polymerase sigma-70 factor, ECF subfamily
VPPSTEFQAIVMANLDSLYGYACALTRRSSEAEDLLQDVLLRAFRAFDSFDRSLSAKAWFFKIMRNADIDRRRRKRTRRVEEDWPVTEDPELSGELHFYTVPLTPEDILLRNLTVEVVRESIRRLPPMWREVVEFREIEGLSYKEIAEVIGKPIGTVMSRLSRGRDLLRSTLQRTLRDGAELKSGADDRA